MFDREKQLKWSQLKVGAIVTLALVILLVAVFFAGGIEKFFYPKTDFRIQFRDVKGLRIGAPVWINGMEVGSVRDMKLDPAFGTIVTVSILRDVAGFIKKDASASVLTMGLLGDRYVDLDPGSQKEKAIEPGELIKGVPQVEFTEIVGASAVTMERMNDFIGKLDGLISRVSKGEGSLARLIEDPELYENLKNSAKNLGALIEDFRNARGTLKMLMEDPSLYKRMVSVVSSMEEFSAALKKNGTLRRLLEDPGLYEKLMLVASDVEALTKKFTDDRGTLGKLLEDRELYDNINRTAGLLASIVSRIEKGEGIAGALIRDDHIVTETKQTLAELKILAQEMEILVRELSSLTKDIRENPRKYFRFSIF